MNKIRQIVIGLFIAIAMMSGAIAAPKPHAQEQNSQTLPPIFEIPIYFYDSNHCKGDAAKDKAITSTYYWGGIFATAFQIQYGSKILTNSDYLAIAEIYHAVLTGKKPSTPTMTAKEELIEKYKAIIDKDLNSIIDHIQKGGVFLLRGDTRASHVQAFGMPTMAYYDFDNKALHLTSVGVHSSVNKRDQIDYTMSNVPSKYYDGYVAIEHAGYLGSYLLINYRGQVIGNQLYDKRNGKMMVEWGADDYQSYKKQVGEKTFSCSSSGMGGAAATQQNPAGNIFKGLFGN